MAGGGFAVSGSGAEFEAKITPIVIISCIMAATGGLMFGYDVGVSGGVTSMDDFLMKFFPSVYKRTKDPELDSNYCKYDNQGLQLFTSSLYLAGLTSTFFASYTTRRLGRRLTMLIAGFFFIAGVVLNAAAQDLAMLIIGRILLGCGVGFANQAVPLFLSEIAPTRIRGGLNILFQLNVTLGILFANLVNYGTSKIHGWGWRLSLGLAGIPALLLTVGALLVVDTPNSLIERGHLDEGKAVLKRIRGTDNVEPEFLELVEASRIAEEVKHPFRNLLMRRNRPQLVIAMALQIFQQFTGINAIMFYAPVLFDTLGFGGDASLYSAVITGAVNVVSTVVSIYSVDKVGRRVLLLEAGVQMFLSQVVIAIILGIKVTDHSNDLHKGYGILVVILICTFVSAFAWSWGPLGWLIPSETFPLETRSAGQSVTVCVNLLFTFVIAQAFLSMLCHFKYGIFLFFSSWVLVMSFFVFFLVPETKNVPIEEMTEMVWKKHWLWKRFMDEYNDDETRRGHVHQRKMTNSDTVHYKSKITPYVFTCWILAAVGGLMFGYDIGISGGVTAMNDFLIKFFPKIYEKKMHATEDNYCKYDDQKLQLFTSSLYLAALVASFFASKACSAWGRRPTILMASTFFIAGAILSASSQFTWMLILGRILFGIGVGFGNEAVPLFLTEVAPAQHRGAVNILFQLFVTIGILIANLVNYFTSKMHPHGWRVSLGVAAAPAVVLLVGSLIITETPSSLVERGKEAQGKTVLKRIRGVEDVEAEFQQIVAACELAGQVKHPFKKLFTRAGTPPLVIAIVIQIFQQLTGINAIMFYAPVLFQTVGFKENASLMSSVITGLVNVLSTFVSICAVDKIGRRKLLLQACFQMLISQIAIGCILKVHLNNTGALNKSLAAVVVIFVCTFVMSFAWSWGPMGWLIPSEIFPMETRTAGFAFAVSSNMIFTFIIAQAFLSMMCHLKAFIFIFFAAWILIMGLFVFFLLPETKGVPIDLIEERVWKQHPVWKRFFKDDGRVYEMK